MDSLPERQDRRSRRISQLRRALETGSFTLVYQPIVELSTREIRHYEALTRFAEGASTSGTVLLAEEVGLVEQFDAIICQRVVDMCGERSRRGCPVDVAINLSGLSLQSPSFTDALYVLLAAAPTPGGSILIEVTETAEIEDLPRVDVVLQNLRSRGHPVCIDDFGTGSSVFQYLEAFDVDYVKIDGAFTSAIEGKGVDRTILREILRLCHKKNVWVIAEKVETESQARLLGEAGVQFGQGYLLGRPMDTIPIPNRA